MKYTYFLSTILLGIVFWGGSSFQVLHQSDLDQTLSDSTTLWDVMTDLGKVNTNELSKKTRYSAQKGRSLVFYGFTTNFEGKKTAKTSKRFTCIACHSTQREHNNLKELNPENRLAYSDSTGVPFLPGAPFLGLINRIAFFTSDYQKQFTGKPLEYVKSGHRNIRQAIQSCNKLYAEGRKLKDWELESILAYFWTLELKIGDLGLKKTDKEAVVHALKTNRSNAKAVNLMRRYYPEVYPAHFPKPIPVEKRKVSAMTHSFKNGYLLYKNSCMYCHGGKSFSKFKLDYKKKTFNKLLKNIDLDSKLSIYNVLRFNKKSKHSKPGAPHFSRERMSDRQIQDLRLFIKYMSRQGDAAFTFFNIER